MYFHALVALKLLVSLISRFVACSARIVVDRQTQRTTTITLAAHARRGLTMAGRRAVANTVWKRCSDVLQLLVMLCLILTGERMHAL